MKEKFLPREKYTNLCKACTATICTYNFTISVIPSSGPVVNSTFPLPSLLPHPIPSNTPPVPCLYNDAASTPPASSTPQTHSYSALACSSSIVDGKPVPSSWQVSWGYNPSGDFAVMTIVDTEKGNDAFL